MGEIVTQKWAVSGVEDVHPYSAFFPFAGKTSFMNELEHPIASI